MPIHTPIRIQQPEEAPPSTSAKVSPIFYWKDGTAFNNNLIKYDTTTRKAENIHDRCLDMSDAYAVQVNQDLFAYKKTPSFVCYSNLTSGPIRKTAKATPP